MESFTTIRKRLGAVNVGLLVVLGVIVLLAAGFWIYRSRSEPVATGEVFSADKSYTLICGKCLGESTVSGPEAAKTRKDDKGQLQCPKCKEFAATYGAPGAAKAESQKDTGIAMP